MCQLTNKNKLAKSIDVVKLQSSCLLTINCFGGSALLSVFASLPVWVSLCRENITVSSQLFLRTGYHIHNILLNFILKR